jgi:hypothetical protein
VSETKEDLHPQLVALIDLCKKIGLNQAEQFLLINLAGWHNRGKGVPFSYDGLEPHVTIIANATKLNEGEPDLRDRFIAESIAEVLRKIIGTELMHQAELNPVETFKGINIPLTSIAWLVAQLGLVNDSNDSKEVSKILREMSSMNPQRFHESDIVRLTIGTLLQRRAQRPLKQPWPVKNSRALFL